MRKGWGLVGFGGSIPKKIRDREGHVIFFSKTLKWHDVLINEVLELKRKKRAEEMAKESREAKHKSCEDYPWAEPCEA